MHKILLSADTIKIFILILKIEMTSFEKNIQEFTFEARPYFHPNHSQKLTSNH